MKEVLGSLPEVIAAYKNYNLLVPTATDVQLNPFYKFHVVSTGNIHLPRCPFRSGPFVQS